VRIGRTNKARSVVQSGGDIAQPLDMVVSPDGRFAYLTSVSAGSDGLGALVRLDLSTGQTALLTGAGELRAPSGLAYDRNGDFLVTHTGLIPPFTNEGRVVRVPQAGGTPEPVSAGGLLSSPEGLAVFAPEPDAALGGAAARGLAARRRRGRRRLPTRPLDPRSSRTSRSRPASPSRASWSRP
jgi:hypothetical protein